MKHFPLALALAGCGGAMMEPVDAGPVPVATTPLQGTIGGAPWTAVSATAKGSRGFNPGDKWVDIGSGTFTCDDFVAESDLIVNVPWATEAYALSLQHNLTFVVHEADGGIQNKVATSGRVEVISAPDAGTATLRIRARFDAQNSVEGQIDVKVCD